MLTKNFRIKQNVQILFEYIIFRDQYFVLVNFSNYVLPCYFAKL